MPPRGAERRLKVRQERLDRINSEVQNALQAWDDRLVFGQPKFRERYIACSLHLNVSVRLRLTEALHEDCFLLLVHDVNGSASPPSDIFGASRPPRFDFVPRVGAGELGAVRNDADSRRKGGVETHNDEQSVFIEVVVGLEDRKGMVVWNRPMVGLQQFNPVTGTPRNALYRSASTGIFKIFDCPTYRKLEIGFDGLAPILIKNERVNQVVEGAPKIVEHFTRENGKPCAHGEANQRKRVLGTIAIMLSDNSIWLSREKSSNLGIEVADIFFGPINLFPAPLKWV